jgi:hypothetical protein
MRNALFIHKVKGLCMSIIVSLHGGCCNISLFWFFAHSYPDALEETVDD